MKKSQDLSFHYLFRGIILIGLTMLIFKLLLTNNISLLIAPKMMWLIYFSFFVLFILGVLLILRGTSEPKHAYHCDCEEEHTYPNSFWKGLFFYLLFIIPITTGFLFANNVLGSSVAMNRTIKLGAHDSAQAKNTSTTNTSTKSVLDYQPDPITESQYNALKDKIANAKTINIADDQYVNMMNIIQDNLKSMIGKTITTKGFVYREKNLMQNQIVVARFGITCCVADASVYGMMAKGNVAALAKDKWVQVTGTIEKTQYDGNSVPILNITKLSKISAPQQPYVFDVGVKVE